jgi:hypothetical protein
VVGAVILLRCHGKDIMLKKMGLKSYDKNRVVVLVVVIVAHRCNGKIKGNDGGSWCGKGQQEPLLHSENRAASPIFLLCW